ncbi:hypothetical protein [Bradyrhizobium sp. NBAIM03]|uniref:hypothetical protein n=1 Tax=Bradyrhizobium sp. NBAIM03 TaxID=2793816 RepID=UPI001CD3EFA9
MHDDRRHQFADGGEFGRGAALQFISQLFDSALVAVERLRVQGDDAVAFFGAFEPGHDLGLFGLKLLHAGDELLWRHARDHD